MLDDLVAFLERFHKEAKIVAQAPETRPSSGRTTILSIVAPVTTGGVGVGRIGCGL